MLGLSRKGLYLKRQRFGLEPPGSRPSRSRSAGGCGGTRLPAGLRRQFAIGLRTVFRQRPAVERRQPHVAHRPQAGRRRQHGGNRVDGDRRGGDVAVHAAVDLRVDPRRPLDEHRVVRLGRAEIGLQVQRDARLAVHVADAVLDDAADVARHRPPAARSRTVPVGDLRLDVVGDAIELPAERVGNHLDRLGEPDVPHGARRRPCAGTARASGRRRSSAGTAAAGCARPARGAPRRGRRARTPRSARSAARPSRSPGLTPVPSTATFAFRAASSSRFASRRLRGAGYATSSVVVTIGTRRFSTSSNCGMTSLSDELVQSTATSGLVALIVLPMSDGHLHAQLAPELDRRRRRPARPCSGRCRRRRRSESPFAPRPAAPPPRRSGRARRASRESSSTSTPSNRALPAIAARSLRSRTPDYRWCNIRRRCSCAHALRR